MKLQPIKLSSSVAIVMLISRVFHALLVHFAPGYYARWATAIVQTLDLQDVMRRAFWISTIHHVIGAFVFTWLVVVIYNRLLTKKEAA